MDTIFTNLYNGIPTSYKVWLVGDTTNRYFTFVRCLRSSEGDPMFFIDTRGAYWNWRTIMRIEINNGS